MSRRQHYQGTLTELKRQATEALSRYEPNHEMAFGYLVSAYRRTSHIRTFSFAQSPKL
jgi:hypothetical protein